MKPLRFAVQGSERATDFCPVSVTTALAVEDLEGAVLLDVARDMPVPHQVEPGPRGCTIFWIVDSLAARQRRAYVLRESGRKPLETGVKVKKEGEGKVAVRVGGELLTRYLYGETAPKPCLYPLMGPFGLGVTRAYPQEELEGDSTDHVHHRSVYVAWGDVNGSDNWSEEEGHGSMVHQYFGALDNGPVFGRIVSLNDWVNAAGERLMQDRLEYRFYNTPPSFRLLDLTVTFFASDGDVRFGDTKEGGIVSLRVASSMEVDREHGRGRIENSLGALNEAETWGKQASWCDYSGLVGDHVVGIAAMDHPGNPGYPTRWHVRNYGLMTANPFGLSHFIGPGHDGSFTLAAGGSAVFRYRIMVHAGRAGEGEVAERYLDWIAPPVAALEE